MANIRRFFSCLVLALWSTLYVSADVFISIDCGSSGSYKDENSILWTGDDKYTKNGESHTVNSSNSISHVMDTLRVFTTRKKNCYLIDSVARGRVLLRASFYYGNYDNKSSPPTFDLQFDGNHWVRIRTSSTEYYSYEVSYVMKSDSISVCIAQTSPGEFPFISALEVRSLESYMYADAVQSYPLFLNKRVAFGSNTTIRYQDDPYDRIWTPEPLSKGLIKVPSGALHSQLIYLGDRPPPAVLKSAVTAISPNTSIELFITLPPVDVSLFINWYFSEVSQLKPNETRSFRIFKDNKSYSEPILPPYENCSEQYVNLLASPNTTFSLVPTNISTLPPLINAMEVFVYGDNELTNGTYKDDVQGLASLQKAFDVLQDWSGDPCLPAPYTWDWINCSNDTEPRVTDLFLGSFGLSGLLPNFSSMDALKTIDLYNNSLRGPIPDFLGRFPNLTTLNVANNQLNGSVPASLSTKRGLNLLVNGNSGVCTSGTPCPAVSSSMSNKNMNLLQILFGTIFPSIMMLH